MLYSVTVYAITKTYQSASFRVTLFFFSYHDFACFYHNLNKIPTCRASMVRTGSIKKVIYFLIFHSFFQAGWYCNLKSYFKGQPWRTNFERLNDWMNHQKKIEGWLIYLINRFLIGLHIRKHVGEPGWFDQVIERVPSWPEQRRCRVGAQIQGNCRGLRDPW